MRALTLVLAYPCFFACLPATATLLPTNKVVLCGGTSVVCVTELNQSTPINMGSTVFTNGGSSITASATVDADATSMVLKTFVSYNSLVGTYYSQMNSMATFSDTLTISSPGLNGQTGYLEMPFNVSGSTSQSGLGNVVTGILSGAAHQFSGCSFTGSGIPINQPQPGCSFSNGVVTTGGAGALLSFQYGTPFNLIWEFDAEVFPSSAFPSGSADYSHTATVLGLEIFNSQGVNLTGANVTIQTAGGEVFAVIATPEPRSTVSSAIGLTMLTALVLAKRRWRTPAIRAEID
jgi:hypothetical protein